MDFLRSCYATKMRFYPTDPTNLTDVVWFFCDHGASPLPRYHRFASRNWSHPLKGSDTLGEVWKAPRSYVRGVNVDHYPGTRSCTPVAYWTAGAPGPVAPFDVDACCGKFTGRAVFGLEGTSQSNRGGVSKVGKAKLGLRPSTTVVRPPVQVGIASLGLRARFFGVLPPTYIGYVPLGLVAVQSSYPAYLGLVPSALVVVGPVYSVSVDLGLRAYGSAVLPYNYQQFADLGLRAHSLPVPPPDYHVFADLWFQGSSQHYNGARLGLRVSAYGRYVAPCVCIEMQGESWNPSIPGPDNTPQFALFPGSVLDTWTVFYPIDPDGHPGYTAIAAVRRNGAFFGQFIRRYNNVSVIGITVLSGSELCGDAPSKTGSGRLGLRGSVTKTLPPDKTGASRLALRGSCTFSGGTPPGYVQGNANTAFGSSVSVSLSGTHSGNMILGHVAFSNPFATMATPAGWTLVSSVIDGSFFCKLNTYKLTSSGGTVSVIFDLNPFSANFSAVLTEWGGVSGTSYGSATASGSGTTITTANIISTHTGDLLVSCLCTSAIANTFSNLSSGWSQDKSVNNATGPCFAVCHNAPASGTYSMHGDASNSMGNGTCSSILALAVP